MPEALSAENKSPLSESARPCVFLDRDGCVTREAGYVNHPDRIELLPGAAGAIRGLNRAGVLTVLVTNQSGVARGYFSEEVLKAVLARMKELLARRGARLDAIYYAPFHPDARDPAWRDDPDELRKPGLGMIRRACRELPIDLARSFMVGDRVSDMLFARAAGIPGIFIKSGYGLGEFTYRREHWTIEPDQICEDLPEAVRWVLRDLKRKGRNRKAEKSV